MPNILFFLSKVYLWIFAAIFSGIPVASTQPFQIPTCDRGGAFEIHSCFQLPRESEGQGGLWGDLRNSRRSLPSKTLLPPSWWWTDERNSCLKIEQCTNVSLLKDTDNQFFSWSSEVTDDQVLIEEKKDEVLLWWGGEGIHKKTLNAPNTRFVYCTMTLRWLRMCRHWGSRAQVIWGNSAHLALSFWVLSQSHSAGKLEGSLMLPSLSFINQQ